MNMDNQEMPWLTKTYFDNRARFPQEELDKYAGKHVAYNWEGDAIVASADSLEELCAKVESAGIDPRRVVFSYVDCG